MDGWIHVTDYGRSNVGQAGHFTARGKTCILNQRLGCDHWGDTSGGSTKKNRLNALAANVNRNPVDWVARNFQHIRASTIHRGGWNMLAHRAIK